MARGRPVERVAALAQGVRETFWFVPSLMCVGAAVLAEGLIAVDVRWNTTTLLPGGVLSKVGVDGGRSLLGTVAGSMLAVASTTFSITIAVLVLTSSNYGPRLVRNFTADRGNQIVLGTYVATFLYALLVLRSIDGGGRGGEPFVPSIAVNVGLVLALLATGLLVWFIHHVSTSIQVWRLAAEVGQDLQRSVEALYPTDAGRPQADVDRPRVQLPEDVGDAVRVTAGGSGYVRRIDEVGLIQQAAERDVLLRVEVLPGDFLMSDSPMVTVWPAERADHDLRSALRAAFVVGETRTPQQDVRFAVQQLVEMAVRALSPGTNDPYTAINALDQLSVGLSELALRRPPGLGRYDDKGVLRVVAATVELGEVADLVLDAVRHYALDAPIVLHRALDLAERVAHHAREPEITRRLDAQVGALVDGYARREPHAIDLDRLREHAARVRTTFP